MKAGSLRQEAGSFEDKVFLGYPGLEHWVNHKDILTDQNIGIGLNPFYPVPFHSASALSHPALS